MKKLVAIVSLCSVFAGSTHASTGTINFTGLLTASTCDVSVDGQGADATVVLPTISANELSSSGKTAGDTGFVISLDNCTGSATKVFSYFEAGANVDVTTGRLVNTGTAGAVSIQLLDNDGSPIEVGNQSQQTNSNRVDIQAGSASLPYIARYYAEGTAAPGTVVSKVVYTIQYE